MLQQLGTLQIQMKTQITRSSVAAWLMLILTVSATGGYRNAVHARRRAAEDHLFRDLPCLPKDVTAGEVVSSGPKGTQRITVERKLAELKARCRNGKLMDAKGREIRFFRLSCWGNPPPDYLEIQQKENKQLADLKKRYTVIVFACNPMIQ